MSKHSITLSQKELLLISKSLMTSLGISALYSSKDPFTYKEIRKLKSKIDQQVKSILQSVLRGV
jgi:hypothetical protein